MQITLYESKQKELSSCSNSSILAHLTNTFPTLILQTWWCLAEILIKGTSHMKEILKINVVS